MSVGKNISVSDNNKAFLDANDDIRGVETICYGKCDSSDNPCVEDTVYIHEVLWNPPYPCVDGGVMRAKQTYTNLDVSGFKTPIGYSGHYYGIRKYTDLIPHAPYDIVIEGKTGSNEAIKLPPQFIEVEYGIPLWSGTKVADNELREAGDKYGKSVAIKNNLMAIGSPMKSVEYSEYEDNVLTTYTLNEAGTVYLYRRGDRPSGTWPEGSDKSPWILETKITLPSGLLKDYYITTTTNNIGGIELPLPILERRWQVGQEGRQFGHSIGVAINSGEQSFEEDRREIVVVGGPSAKWTNRAFEELETSGVQIGLLVFTDEFKPTIPNNAGSEYTFQNILNAINNKDLIFQYFSDPPVKFDIKVIICEPIADYTNRELLDFNEPKPSFIVKKRIARNQGSINTQQNEKILNDIKNAFHVAFPYDENKLNNNIPALLGVYVDESRSLGEQAINPALNNFLAYYREYSFASGLRDFYDVRSSGEVIKYNGNRSENWILSSVDILNNVLDTGRLLENNQVRFFSDKVGSEAFNSNLSQFNYPPDSGGKVFIFEKESGSWNLIQEIKSPTLTYSHPDRFGHAVAISDNTEIISIGSPYIGESCKIYEYKPLEKQRMYDQLDNWISFKSSSTGGIGYYANLLDSYNNWVSQYGSEYAAKILYSKLSSTDKFYARQYLNIEEYQNIYTYSGPSIIAPSWRFIVDNFIPSSRLGYSTAVNEDGSIVAFGAPTDSLNKWDDSHVYYKNVGYYNPIDNTLNSVSIQPSWRSNVNAGAVRLFESRKYYPHDTVVEYGKFGNLQKTLGDPLDSGYFNVLSSVFSDKNFRVTQFSEVNIPTEAGLAFIITPEIDAVSEEIINNIIEWLSLGDRNLVLVGNDPVFEQNGAYASSNDIVNKILDSLDSRMKLYPAKNNFESLSSECGNAIPSFIPAGSTPSYVQPLSVPAFGVGDIRLNLDNTPLSNLSIQMPCDDIGLNSKCQLPLSNGGDLRAEWFISCYNSASQKINYSANIPYLFKTQTPPCYDMESIYLKDIRIDLQNQEPVPLLVAATQVVQNVVIPAVPSISGVRPIYGTEEIRQASYVASFDQNNISNNVIVWDSGHPNDTNIQSNITGSNSAGLFYNPNIVNNRKGILQATAVATQAIVESNNIISDRSYYCVEDNVGSSKIIAIAGLLTESANILYTGSSEDRNLNFYLNLVSKTTTSNGGSNIAQLGDWTGRSSFKDAFNDSILFEIFQNSFNDVRLNADKLYSTDDVCWIANPLTLPSDNQLLEIINWLNLGNKKLIITYDNSLSQVTLTEQLFSLLNSQIKPLYLTVKDEYAQSSSTGELTFNSSHPVSQGYDLPSSIATLNIAIPFTFIPFKLENGVTPICFNFTPIIDKQLNTVGYWKLDSGITKFSFPAIAGSGYKVFINTLSEVPSENQKLDIYITNASTIPSVPYPNANYTFSDTIGTNYKINKIGQKYQFNTTGSATIDLQVIENASSIDFYISSYDPRLSTVTNSYIPKTTQLLSISGVALPILNNLVSQTYTTSTIIGYENYLISEARPEVVISTSRLEPISSLNNKYCNAGCNPSLSNQLINDGPVIAAQEIEHISSFDVGVNRSRITLLSDSALVQGRCVGDEFFRLSANTVQFLRSLYPNTVFPATNNSGRQFNTLTKIVAPERGSPQKYYALTDNIGNNTKFGGGTRASLSSFSDKESHYDPKYVIRPPEPWEDYDDDETKQEKINIEIDNFITEQANMGGATKYSGIIDGTLYTDIGVRGGMPDVMKDTGKDYLDFDLLPSGYPGDLFGYSISLYKNKLVVGSPFSAFSSQNINPWSFYVNGGPSSGIMSSYNGGAGSVYIFEKTFKGSGLHGSLTPWEFTQKLRPFSINAGQDLTDTEVSQSDDQLGANSYSESYLTTASQIGDRFGTSVDIASDIIIVGAPGHDFDNIYIDGEGDFIRKCFNTEFNIPSRQVIDLGSSGIRLEYPNSGITVLNQGAIFTFENSIVDWNSKTQQWTLIEKVIPQGYNSRLQDSTNDDYFGESVSIDRSFRSDADYTIVGGSYHHVYGSGNSENSDDVLIDAGASYSNDIMLRIPNPVTPNPLSFIDAKVFGDRDESQSPTVRLLIINNNENSTIYYSSGVVYSDNNGQIFIEVSGKDPSTKGFIVSRPFIARIDGKYHYGTPINNSFSLFTSGTTVKTADMNIFTNVDNSSFVYNSIGLYNGAILGFASGIPSGLSLYLDCPDPINISESGLCLYTASGTGLSTDSINLSIRGK